MREHETQTYVNRLKIYRTLPVSMTTLRSFRATDLLRFNTVNLDHLTETYYMPFYQQYLATWSDLFIVAQAASGSIAGYMMGKVEGQEKNWHGHVTAVTVAPMYRRLGLAKQLMVALEDITEYKHKGYFVDLYVRVSNIVAVRMYKQLGYIVYRRVLGYYGGEEDAYDMRKATKWDTNKESEVPCPRPSYPTADD